MSDALSGCIGLMFSGSTHASAFRKPSGRRIRSRLSFATAAALWLVGAMTGCAAVPARTLTPSADGLGPAREAVNVVPFGSGFERPVYFTNAANGSGPVFVVEQAGRVIAVSGDGSDRRTFWTSLIAWRPAVSADCSG